MGSGRSGLYLGTHGSIANFTRRLIPGVDGVVSGGNPTILGKNLLRNMGVDDRRKWAGYQAHHIIPSQLINHPVIKKMGMDFDDSSNGIFFADSR